MAMTPWEIIEEALQRMRPARGAQWLADRLDMKVQAVSNWKTRRVPPSKYRAIAGLVNLTVDQIEGVVPPPWEKPSTWPFPDAQLLSRVEMLDHDQRVEIQAKIREMVEKFESAQQSQSGKFTNSTPSVSRAGSR